MDPYIYHCKFSVSDTVLEMPLFYQYNEQDQGFLQWNIAEGEDGKLLLREEGRYNSCHLFLSGEDNSPITSAPVSANVSS